MKEAEMKEIAKAIAIVLSDPQNPAKIAEAQGIVGSLTSRFPLPY
jgi:glycine/serine hydroxymethyltransferase